MSIMVILCGLFVHVYLILQRVTPFQKFAPLKVLLNHFGQKHLHTGQVGQNTPYSGYLIYMEDYDKEKVIYLPDI